MGGTDRMDPMEHLAPEAGHSCQEFVEDSRLALGQGSPAGCTALPLDKVQESHDQTSCQ